MKKIIVLLLITLLSPAFSATWWVDAQNGNNSYAGTSKNLALINTQKQTIWPNRQILKQGKRSPVAQGLPVLFWGKTKVLLQQSIEHFRLPFIDVLFQNFAHP